MPGTPTRSKKRQGKGRAKTGSTAANVLMQPLPDGAMPEATSVVRDLNDAIAFAQASPRWPEPRLVAAVARAQKSIDLVRALDKKVEAAADAQKVLEIAELPRPPEGCTAEAPGPRCGQPYRIKVEPNVEEEIAWPSLPRPPEAAGITK